MTSGKRGSSPPCKVDDCNARSVTREWCYKHYVSWRKYGDPTVRRRPQRYDGQLCNMPTCPHLAECRGWCGKHYQRWKANGDPLKLARRARGSGSITVDGYLIVTDPKHPLSNARGLLAHRKVLLDKIGPGSHPCHWCNKVVSWDLTFPASPDALVVDHLDGDRLNNDPGNLVPSCGQCNLTRAPEASDPGVGLS